jgi:hypothetical protein
VLSNNAVVLVERQYVSTNSPRLPARALRLGNYRVAAIYGGDSNTHASTSVVAKLKIN